MGLTSLLKEYAAELGLACGIALPEEPAGAAARLKEREDAGYISPLARGTGRNRTSPRLHLAEVRSVIVVAQPYYIEPGRSVPEQPGQGNRAEGEGDRAVAQPVAETGPWHGIASPEGKTPAGQSPISWEVYPENPGPVIPGFVARVGRGSDYHLTLRAKLQSLEGLLQRESAPAPGSTLVLVDSHPLLERELACQAGLGFIGSNCCLINPGAGSWVNIGLLLTGVKLEPSPIAADPFSGCRSCRACLQACPTGALVAAGVLNARRCLSYITQAPGEIPHEFRPLLGRRLYGCDDCQEVCPHNRGLTADRGEVGTGTGYMSKTLARSRIQGNNRQHSRSGTAGSQSSTKRASELPDLVQVLRMDREEFVATWRLTAAGWRGRNILRRNAAVALGNSGQEEAVPFLIDALSDPSPLVRGHAAWSLGLLRGNRALRALEMAKGKESEAWVRDEIELALAGLPVDDLGRYCSRASEPD